MGIEGGGSEGNISEFQKRTERMLKSRNPHTEADEQAVLDALTVMDVTALPESIQTASRQYATRQGGHVKDLPDGTKLHITTFPNDILDVQRVRKSKRRVLWYQTYDLLSYHTIDTVSQKAFDVTQLWKTPEGGEEKPLDVLVVPNIQEIGLAPTKEGDVIVLGSYKPTQRMPPNYIGYLKRTALSHEVAHHLQSTRLHTSELSVNQMLLERKFRFLLQWKRLMDALVSRPGPMEKENRRALQLMARTHRVWEERNAHAFTLSLVRKLRMLGVDMMRGMSVTDIFKQEDRILQTYDAKKWLSTDRPLAAAASQQDRRFRRGMDKTYRSSALLHK